MARVECPHCGELVSSNSKFCAHCGGEIFVCPECGEVFDEWDGECPECGYSDYDERDYEEEYDEYDYDDDYRSRKNKKSSKSNPKSVLPNNMDPELKAKLDKNRSVSKGLKISGTLIGVFGVILLVVFVPICLTKPELPILLNENVIGFLVMTAFSATMIELLFKWVAVLHCQYACGDWLRKHGYDISKQIKKAGAQSKSSENPYQRDYKNLVVAAFISARPGTKFLKIIPSIFNNIIAAVLMFALCVGLIMLYISGLEALSAAGIVIMNVVLFVVILAIALIVFQLMMLPFHIVFGVKKKNWYNSI